MTIPARTQTTDPGYEVTIYRRRILRDGWRAVRITTDLPTRAEALNHAQDWLSRRAFGRYRWSIVNQQTQVEVCDGFFET